MAYSKFANQVKAFAEKAKRNLNATVKEVIIGVAADLVDRSPVGDPTLWASKANAIAAYGRGYVGGHFKANWVGGVGEINTLVTDDIDPTGEVSMLAIQSAIPDDATKAIFYISNSLPYADRLENGWSTQAPAGMVGLAVIDFKGTVNAAVTKVAS